MKRFCSFFLSVVTSVSLWAADKSPKVADKSLEADRGFNPGTADSKGGVGQDHAAGQGQHLRCYGRGGDHDDWGTFTIDTSVKLHRMTIKSESGPSKGKTILAVFEHKHKDAMRVCYDLSGKQFPKVWRTRKGSPLYAVGYRR
ncbi:MAG: hypothetical protein CMO80_06545 [Verrucomicrobiales bacterium]|nr:hypothetical protein [Verrucomicrobiales bacterium]|tara:strand:- start:101 stop:529 length:429 start_codon:yes stop_codon:yes gene_type:complete